MFVNESWRFKIQELSTPPIVFTCVFMRFSWCLYDFSSFILALPPLKEKTHSILVSYRFTTLCYSSMASSKFRTKYRSLWFQPPRNRENPTKSCRIQDAIWTFPKLAAMKVHAVPLGFVPGWRWSKRCWWWRQLPGRRGRNIHPWISSWSISSF